MKIMIWNAARGGMRSVVEGYVQDGFVASQGVHLIHSYADGSFVHRQMVLARALAQFARMLVTEPVGLVHIHAAMRGSFWRKSLFARMARARGVPVLLHLHGSEMKAFYERQSPRLQAAITGQLELATRVLVLSESWRDFVQIVAPGARVVVVPNYVTVPPQIVRPRTSNTTLLFLGLIGPRKGTYDLLRAFARASSEYPSLRLVLGGNGEVEEARRLSAELGIAERVDFRGWVGPQERVSLLADADVYVLPSYNEGLPMSVLEAMAAGLPVITTDVGGIPELITNGRDGVLVTPGDINALAAAITRLAYTAEERERLGAAARARVLQHYSHGVVIKLLDAVYAETSAANPTASRAPDPR
ncbi:glycosyltransferase family 4 protein [Salinarimonas soli]|uniref:Glycosyltransferase family 4 protein n=1 Tax=Salinarimonas soli TaxID=1638099 RepID=A0A5B2VE06_9HYPH|nr:glycosyltransferase family 4 protein [Salinarimonas soli]KAA2236918.1 glycosyltransferase family 4 protein [Salinarimonas soli]